MIKIKIFIILMLVVNSLTSQVLCVHCYNSNNRISQTVTNLISNGSFENTNCGINVGNFCPNSAYFNCEIPFWT